MATKITYVGGTPDITFEVPTDDGRFAVIVMEKGDTVEVPDDFAGRAPSGTPGEDDHDLGEGLLAQVANFVPAKAKAKTTVNAPNEEPTNA